MLTKSERLGIVRHIAVAVQDDRDPIWWPIKGGEQIDAIGILDGSYVAEYKLVQKYVVQDGELVKIKR